jgi:hypothetical protein
VVNLPRSCAGVSFGFRLPDPPTKYSSLRAAHEFSAERAFEHLKVIAKEPHPTGSVANMRARDYLVDQLKSLGLEPQIQKAVAATSWDIGGAPYRSAAVANVLGRINGTNKTGDYTH